MYYLIYKVSPFAAKPAIGNHMFAQNLQNLVIFSTFFDVYLFSIFWKSVELSALNFKLKSELFIKDGLLFIKIDAAS